MEKTTKNKNCKKIKTTYVNVNRAKTGYRDKYKRDVEKAILEFASNIGKTNGDEFTQPEWKKFFKTVLIPLDKETERKMIDLFIEDRDELNQLLILHNTLASNNIAEVAFKKYEKESPNKWHDLEDFKQMALEGLAVAAQRFDPNKYDNKFITFATWWMLNKVLKAKQDEPHRKNGSIIGHTSLNAPSIKGEESDVSLEEVLTPDMIACDYQNSSYSIKTPIDAIESDSSESDCDLFNDIRHLSSKSVDTLDADRVRKMAKYLVSVIEENGDSYGSRQIYLYMFKRIFNKCVGLFNGGESNYSNRISSYMTEAAKSKKELLDRLNMNEDQYKMKCKTLLGKTYSGI